MLRTIVMTISQSSRPNERMIYPLTTVRNENAIHATTRYALETPIMVFALPSRPMTMGWCDTVEIGKIWRSKSYVSNEPELGWRSFGLIGGQ